MNFTRVGIEAMAYALPSKVVTSDELEACLSPLYDKLNLQYGRLELMTGIRERRFWPSSHLPSQASAEAGRKLLENGIGSKQIDMLVHSSVCRDRLEPATASYVHRELQLGPDTQIMDVSNACLGFINSVVLVAGMIESKQIKRALVVAAENGKPLIDQTITHLNEGMHDRKSIKPFFANLTIGAASVAWSIADKDLLPAGSPLMGTYASETDSSFNHLCEGDSASDGMLMETHSEELLESGIKVAKGAWIKLLNDSGWEPDTAELIITHQVGKAHTNAVLHALHLNPDKNFSTFEKLGNCGSSSLPITYTLACEENPDRLVSKTVLLGIGSGLSSLMLCLNP